MKTGIALVSILFLFACNSKQAEQPIQVEAPELEMKAAQQLHIPKEMLASELDPVCQMSVAEAQADTFRHEGKLYGFCGPGCKDAFMENPASYLK